MLDIFLKFLKYKDLSIYEQKLNINIEIQNPSGNHYSP